MLISLLPVPFDHFHFHPTLGLNPALLLAMCLLKCVPYLHSICDELLFYNADNCIT